MVPHTAGERDLFLMLSATAGFCEELLYRGFLISYLAPTAGTVGAALLSSVLFGAVHAYQGPAGMLRTAGIGFVTALLYVASG